MKIPTFLILAAFFLFFAATGLSAKDGELSDPRYLEIANRSLSNARLPLIPTKAKKLQCYAWHGNSAGIYATFVLKGVDMTQYLASIPSNMHSESPIPAKLLAPPNAAAPWFIPGGITKGSVLSRERLLYDSPFTFRLYIDAPNSRIFLYYSWINSQFYPWEALKSLKLRGE